MQPNLKEPADVALLNKVLFETFTQQYQNLSNLLNKISLPPQFRANAMLNFDQGFLWVKEAFILMNLSQTQEKPDKNSEDNIITMDGSKEEIKTE